jgi:LysR family glycine cleavage system transcriptional activator
MELFSMATQAARHGLGAALVPEFFVHDEVERGLLIVVPNSRFASDGGYYLIYPETGSVEPYVASLRDWLVSQAADDVAPEAPSREPRPQVPRSRSRGE